MDRRSKKATVISSHDVNQSHEVTPTSSSTVTLSPSSTATIETANQCSNKSRADGDAKMTAVTADLVKIPGLDKYSLRPKSIKNRIEVELKRKTPVKKTPKPKGKPVPLSKYRRRTANARERSRMQEINDAFEELRSAIPDILAASHVSSSSGDEGHHRSSSSQSNNKNPLSKITTLRLAVNYIASLAELLKEPTQEMDSSPSSNSSSVASKSQTSNREVSSSTTPSVSSSTTVSTDMIPSPLGLSSLDLELDDLNGMVSSDFDSSFLSFYTNEAGHPHSCSSIDLPSSYHSPANSTETDSGESYSTSNSSSLSWDSLHQSSYHHSLTHHQEGLEDVCDTFDLILESNESQAMS